MSFDIKIFSCIIKKNHFTMPVKMTCTIVDKNGQVIDYTFDTGTHTKTPNPEAAKVVKEYMDRTRPKYLRENNTPEDDVPRELA